MNSNTALIMLAVMAAFGLVMASAVVLPSIQQAQADKPGTLVCTIKKNGKTVCHPQGPP
jgi:hypothetical protein